MTGAVAAVEIDGVTKRFDEVVAVDNVDLAIGDGEFFALLGPSGCGKTTTLRMIAGLDLPTEGSLRIFGEEVGMAPPDRRPVNTVFQAYALFPHMTVRQKHRVRSADAKGEGTPSSAGEWPRPSGWCASREWRTADPISSPAASSSGWRWPGPLVNQPKVLLLDEPLGALDLKLRQEMQQELKALQNQVGITFVFVTHDQEEALAMSERIGVMSEGRLLQVGTPREIYERPASRFVADFIGRTNLIEASVESSGTVRFANGVLVEAETSAPPGSDVAVSLRPERIRVQSRGTAVRSRCQPRWRRARRHVPRPCRGVRGGGRAQRRSRCAAKARSANPSLRVTR